MSPVWYYIDKDLTKKMCVCREIGCKATWTLTVSTSVLATHLSNVHSISAKDREDSDHVNEENKENSVTAKPPKTPPQRHSDPKQAALVTLLVIFVISAMMPYSICNDQSFRNLLKAHYFNNKIVCS